MIVVVSQLPQLTDDPDHERRHGVAVTVLPEWLMMVM